MSAPVDASKTRTAYMAPSRHTTASRLPIGSNDASVASLAVSGRCGCVLASALGMRHSSCLARACGSFTTARFADIAFQEVDPDKPGVAASASAAICASRAAAAAFGFMP